MNASTDSTLRRIDLAVTRLLQTQRQVPTERRAGFLEARKHCSARGCAGFASSSKSASALRENRHSR